MHSGGPASALHSGRSVKGGDLEPPVRLTAAGAPIEAGELGHAAPFVADFDGDRVKDLLVGQFAGGILRVYRNEGTDTRPRLAAGFTFQDGRPEGRVPTG